MGNRTLSDPPSIGPLYARAALSGKLHRGDALPESVYTLTEQRIDLDHLAEYQRVCGFPVSDVLPPTYLHIVAFPVTVALMLESAFPFPLIGLVHVANSITTARAVRAEEMVSFRVRAGNLRPHAAGRQLDLLVDASVADERVWSGRSTYLRRSGRSTGRAAGEPKPRAELSELPGPAVLVRVPDNIGRKYGAVSGDRNPIHMYALSAKAFGFPSAIAHGMWLKARTLATLEGRLPAACTVEVAFKTPVRLPSTIAIAAIRDGTGWGLDVRSAGSGKPHLTGTVTGS